MSYRDPRRVEAISNEFCQALHFDADSGALNWQSALDTLVEAFPGSFGVLIAQNKKEGFPVPFWAGDIDKESIRTYTEHFCYVNPWLEVWNKLPAGSVRVSEKHSPARKLAGTEFYEDWLRPLVNGEASAAIKLCEFDGFQVHMPIHFELKNAEYYGEGIQRVLETLSPRLVWAAYAERKYSQAYAGGSLDQICRTSREPIFILEVNGRIVDLNRAAEVLIKKKHISVRLGYLHPTSQIVSNWLETNLIQYRASKKIVNWRRVFDVNDQSYIYELVPLDISRASEIFMHKQVFSLRIISITETPERDFSLFEEYFELTPAEGRICKLLASGRSVKQTAVELNNTENTVRSALKIIFDKTKTNRQGELIALCNKFCE